MFSVLRHIVVGGHVLKRFWKDEGAAVGTEYAFLLALISMGMAGAMLALADVVAESVTAAAELIDDGRVVPPEPCCD